MPVILGQRAADRRRVPRPLWTSSEGPLAGLRGRRKEGGHPGTSVARTTVMVRRVAALASILLLVAIAATLVWRVWRHAETAPGPEPATAIVGFQAEKITQERL